MQSGCPLVPVFCFGQVTFYCVHCSLNMCHKHKKASAYVQDHVSTRSTVFLDSYCLIVADYLYCHLVRAMLTGGGGQEANCLLTLLEHLNLLLLSSGEDTGNSLSQYILSQYLVFGPVNLNMDIYMFIFNFAMLVQMIFYGLLEHLNAGHRSLSRHPCMWLLVDPLSSRKILCLPLMR